VITIDCNEEYTLNGQTDITRQADTTWTLIPTYTSIYDIENKCNI